MKYLTIIVVRDPASWYTNRLLPWLQEANRAGGNVVWHDHGSDNDIWVATVLSNEPPPEHEDVVAVISL